MGSYPIDAGSNPAHRNQELMDIEVLQNALYENFRSCPTWEWETFGGD